MASFGFTARIESVGPGQSAAWVSVDFPRSVGERFPTRGTVPVAGTIGGFPFRTSASPDGRGGHSMMVITPRARAEWVGHVLEAKRAETRARRIAKTVERLACGVRRVYD